MKKLITIFMILSVFVITGCSNSGGILSGVDYDTDAEDYNVADEINKEEFDDDDYYNEDSTDYYIDDNDYYNGESDDVTDSNEDYDYDLPLSENTFGTLEYFDSEYTYKMYVPANGLVEMHFSSEGGSGLYYLIFESEETLDDTSAFLWKDSFYGGADRQLFRMRLAEGSYYLKVSGDDTDVVEGSYSVFPDFTDESGYSNIESENNDSKDTADRVEIGVEMTGNINTNPDDYGDYDIDYYCFEIYEETVLRLDMSIKDFSAGVSDYKLSGVFGNYEVSNNELGGDEYEEYYTKTVRLEPGTYYFSFTLDDYTGVSLEESADYYFTITEQ